MDVAIAIIVIVVAVIGVVTAVAAIRKKPPAQPIEGLGLPKQVGPPNPAGKPWFNANPGEPGFKVISVTGGPVAPIIPPTGTGTGVPGKSADGFSFVEGQNLTAICKLTGKPAGECTCDRHKAVR